MSFESARSTPNEMSPDTSIARVEGARPPGRLDRSGPEMFGYFTGAAKKAVSRRGKEPHKFRFARARPHQ